VIALFLMKTEHFGNKINLLIVLIYKYCVVFVLLKKILSRKQKINKCIMSV